MSFSSTAFIGTPGGVGGRGPESLDEVEIPGFPKAPWSKQGAGYAASLQVSACESIPSGLDQ